MSKIVCLKLMTGEELICKEVMPGAYKDVAAIMMVPGSQNNGQIGLALMPFLPYSDNDTFNIRHDAIMIEHVPSTEMLNNYSRKFGAGIQVVGSV